MIRDARLVLADVSGRNANVLYELGLAHALAKPAIILSASIADVPFDLKNLRVLDYDVRKPTWADDLRTRIGKAIKEVLERPALYVPLPYIEERPRERTVKVNRRDKAKIELEQRLQALALEVQELRQRMEPDRSPSRPSFDVDMSAGVGAQARKLMEIYKGVGIAKSTGTMADLVRLGGEFKAIGESIASTGSRPAVKADGKKEQS
jgi:hypothetical protein